MKKNKKGFTLVELLAVVVILIVIFLLGLFATNKYVDRSRRNAFVAEANVIVKGALERYSMDRSENDMSMDIYSGTKPERACYSIEDALIGVTVTKNDAKGYSGSVEICSASDCEYATKIWLNFGEYYIDGVTGEIKNSDIKESFTDEYSSSCGVPALFGGTSCDDDSCDYEYNGGTYRFVAPYTGVYALEVWGAQGGYAVLPPYTVGGYGGYSYGEIELQKNDKIYITVGGKGNDANNGQGNNGYNGGGQPIRTGTNYGQTTFYTAGGGGATHIAFTSGLLQDLNSKKDYIIIVAGGGGGGGIHGTGDGNGGGFNGGASACGVGATQTTGNALGKGADSSQTRYYPYHHSGSGGGYYGGSYPWCNGASEKNFTGYGGSGYINYPLLKNKYMYGYNVNTSDEIGTKTYTTTNVSDKPVKDYAKRGDGYARITYSGANFSGE